jgi:branched-chain amino acid transport system ATP-binding protein
MTTPILKVKQLHAAYGKAQVLHGLDVDIAKGSVITVIGPNGAGKSTFLNCLMGILPSQGMIEFNGQSINELTLEERVMQGISLVPENRELFSTMTVEDNLMLGGYRQMRLGNTEWRSRIDDVFDLFPRLKERRLQAAGTLSGGER